MNQSSLELEQIRRAYDEAPVHTFHLNLVKLCEQAKHDLKLVDWTFFPTEVSIDVRFVDEPHGYFTNHCGKFHHSGTAFLVQVILPLTVAHDMAPGDVCRSIESMLTSLMKRRDFTSQSMKLVDEVSVTMLLGNYASVGLKTFKFSDICVVRRTIDDALDDICKCIDDMKTYNILLDGVFKA